MATHADRRRQAKAEDVLLARGLDPRSQAVEPLLALMRRLYDHLEKAKRKHDLAPLLDYLYGCMQGSLAALRDVKTGCRKGCWFCCTTWVDATAPELIYAMRDVRRGSPKARRAADAFARFGALPFVERARTVAPCPMLEDNACSIYDDRPALCRAAASTDAAACERAFLMLAPEPFPSPVLHVRTGTDYALAVAAALKHAGLNHRTLELMGGMARVLVTDNAEARWLDGEDIFAGLQTGPHDTLADPHHDALYRAAFA
ncbi:MAG: YkgJ family cysteine cluster protein [Bauldia sp.]